MQTINSYLESYCTSQAVWDTKHVPWTRKFRKNWGRIFQEYKNYINQLPESTESLPLHSQLTPLLGSCDKQQKWKTLYLRTYNKDTDIMQHFPLLKSLLDSVPCSLAFFSILKPGAFLAPHKGVYKGVIRYHLALKVPKNYKNCFLEIDDKILHWKTGKDILFDDTFLHSVQNNTNQERVVLFLDIQRDFKNSIINTINTLLLSVIQTNDTVLSIVKTANKYNKI